MPPALYQELAAGRLALDATQASRAGSPTETGSCKGVVVKGAGRCFCAGADISQFGTETEAPVRIPRDVTDMLGFEGLSVPAVAAIHGYALG